MERDRNVKVIHDGQYPYAELERWRVCAVHRGQYDHGKSIESMKKPITIITHLLLLIYPKNKQTHGQHGMRAKTRQQWWINRATPKPHWCIQKRHTAHMVNARFAHVSIALYGRRRYAYRERIWERKKKLSHSPKCRRVVSNMTTIDGNMKKCAHCTQ